MRILITAMAMALSTGAAAQQQMFKCKDTAGKITYSGKECSLLGLSSAGEVTGRISMTPALKSAPSPRPPAAARDAAPPGNSQAKTEEPKEPERRCFVVKLAKGGTATRCNEVPEEPK